MSDIRYGIIGSGMMGHEHIRNIHLLDGAVIAAVADPDEGMRNTAQKLAGAGCKAYSDYMDMMRDGVCDVLLIASPNHTHIDVLRDVMPFDLPILAEKPLCTTLADCEEVLEMQKARTKPIWVAMEYRYMAPVTKLIEDTHAGRAGRPHMVSIKEHRFPFLEKVGDWNRFSDQTGGTLVEKCCHHFNLMTVLAQSDVVRVYASAGVDVNHLDERYDGRVPDIIDNAFVILDFANGMRGMLDLCMFAEGAYWQEILTIVGEDARIEAYVPGPARFSPDGQERAAEVRFSPRDTKIEVHEPVHVDEAILAAGDHHGSTFYQHQKFLKMVREGGEPEVTLEAGLKSVQIGLAAQESARTGMPVLLA